MDSRFGFEALATHARQLRVCRTIECDRDAQDQDDFCMKCREEIDAVRAEARRSFLIWGASGSLSRGTGTDLPRDVQPWRHRPQVASDATSLDQS
jgi:hypothetical protein